MILLPRQDSNHSTARPVSHIDLFSPSSCSLKHVLDGYCSSQILVLATTVGCSTVNTAKVMPPLSLSLRTGSDLNHAEYEASVPSLPSQWCNAKHFDGTSFLWDLKCREERGKPADSCPDW